MLVSAVVLMVVGVLVSLGSFLYALKNMNDFGEKDFDSIFGNHPKSMAGMVMGMIPFMAGIVTLLIHLFG